MKSNIASSSSMPSSLTGGAKAALPAGLKITLKKTADIKPASEEIDLGEPPINKSRIIQQIIESNTSLVRTLKELVENSLDAQSTRVDLEVVGRRTDKGSIIVQEVLIKDNGKGMSHDMVLVNFRGLCQANEDTHESGQYSGKNGVGVKTLFNFFRFVDVETTTAKDIPAWRDWASDSIDEDTALRVMASYEQASDLKPGDPDTEMRKYHLEATSAKIIKPWSKCDAQEHGTTVRIHGLRGGKRLVVEEDELMFMLSSHFQWIKEREEHNEQFPVIPGSGIKEQGLFLVVKDMSTAAKVVFKKINAFDHTWHKVGFDTNQSSGPYLTCTGNSSSGIHFSYNDKEGNLQKDVLGEPDFMGAFDDTDKKFDDKRSIRLDDVNFKLQLTHSVPSNQKHLLIQICGSNISIPEKMFSSVSQGHGMRAVLRGVIYSNDVRLKKALRHNRTDLEENEPIVRAFWSYVKDVLNRMSKYYERFTKDLGVSSDSKSLEELKQSLAGVFNVQKKENENEGGTHSPAKNKRWMCEECDHCWTTPIEEGDPIECPECGSRVIGRAKNGGSRSFEVVWVPGLPEIGEFVASHYNQETKLLRLNRYHPDFVDLRIYSVVTPKLWPTVKVQRMAQHALIAWSASKMADGNQFLKEKGQVDKKYFLRDPKAKAALQKELEKDKISLNSI